MPLVALASALLVGLLVLCEFVRVQSTLTAISIKMTAFFSGFTDTRDSGMFIISHLSLLVGLSAPFWFGAVHSLVLSSGVLALGVADVLGVVIGRTFGSVGICRGSKKTVEGTIGAILGTLGFALAWDSITSGSFFGSLREGGGGQGLGLLTFACLTVGMCLLEAFTAQLDNLYVPLLYFATLLLAQTHADQCHVLSTV